MGRNIREEKHKPANRKGKTRLTYRGTNEGQVQTIRETQEVK